MNTTSTKKDLPKALSPEMKMVLTKVLKEGDFEKKKAFCEIFSDLITSYWTEVNPSDASNVKLNITCEKRGTFTIHAELVDNPSDDFLSLFKLAMDRYSFSLILSRAATVDLSISGYYDGYNSEDKIIREMLETMGFIRRHFIAAAADMCIKSLESHNPEDIELTSFKNFSTSLVSTKKG